tara:strand:- start:1168 stop:1383 length:216 start_codon:yes stop_codon:yes gene_type:complete
MEIGHQQDWQVFLSEFDKETRPKLTLKSYKLICELHSIYYKHKYFEPCVSCNVPKLLQWIDEINEIYEKHI